MTTENKKTEPKMDANALYREEVFTDHQTGSLRRLTPVQADGSADTVRKTIYIGEAQLLTSAGALPLSFEIQAGSLGEAARKYGEGVKQAYEDALEEFQEMRRRANSGVVIPGAGGAGLEGLGGGGMPPGGLPGGGKLKL